MAPKYSSIIKELGEERVKQGEWLNQHTTFAIGGPADLFYEAKTTKELIKAVKLAKKFKIPYFIFGGGSKLLVADKGFRGLVIRVQSSPSETGQAPFKVQNEKIIAEAGVSLANLVTAAAKHSLSGLEFAVGIPGTIGGAVRGNAGAWQESVGDKVLRVKVLTKEGRVKWIGVQDCQFGYRQSRFKKSGEIILEVELELKKRNPEEIKKKMVVNLEKRKRQPREPSVGSIFVNPKPDSAGYLIEACGLKGKKIGDAQISPQHANFIVNLGKATAEDVVQLIKLAKKAVRKKFGIGLKEEICLLGFDKID